MKPSEALTAISMVGDLVVRLDQKIHTIRCTYLSLLADIDNDPTRLAECGELAAVILEEENDGSAETAPFAASMPPAPKLRADGQPRQKPGRKPKAHSNEDRMQQGELPEMAVRLPVDQEKNSAEIAALRRALANGPLTPEELLSVSGLSADAIGAHGRAAAIVEIVDATREAHGRFKAIEEPRLLFRLVSVGAKP